MPAGAIVCGVVGESRSVARKGTIEREEERGRSTARQQHAVLRAKGRRYGSDGGGGGDVIIITIHRRRSVRSD